MMIIKKSIMLLVSLFPLYVLANSVSVESPDFEADVKIGNQFRRVNSDEISFFIPKGLSVEAYATQGFIGESINYPPGEYNELSNVKSFKVKEEYIEKTALEMVFNEYRPEDPTFCLDAKYLRAGFGFVPLGEICSGTRKVLLESVPDGMKNGDMLKLVLEQKGNMVLMAQMGIQNGQVEFYNVIGSGAGMQVYGGAGVINVNYNYNPY